MKKLGLFLLVIVGFYGAVGNALVDVGTKAVNTHSVKMQQAGA